MNWKSELQLSDYERSVRFEVTCKRCGHTRYEDQDKLSALPGLKQARLADVESALRCSDRFCRGPVRLSLTHDDKTEGFTGGLA